MINLQENVKEDNQVSKDDDAQVMREIAKKNAIIDSLIYERAMTLQIQHSTNDRQFRPEF